MKKIAVIVWFILLPQISLAAPDVPIDLTLSAGETAITVNWTANTDPIDGYYIHWGKSAANLDMRKTISTPTAETYTIPDLDVNTTYYVAISAFDASSESEKSGVVSMTTLADDNAPATPTGFGVSTILDITNSTVDLVWTKNTEGDLANYKIHYGTSSRSYSTVLTTAGADVNAYHVIDLISSERYYFAISAVDTSDNESVKTDELIVDTLADANPPNIPENLSAELTGSWEISITFDSNNDGMVDLEGHKLYYGTATGSYETPVDIGKDTSYVLSGLSDNITYYFAVSSYDYSGNESGKSDEESKKSEEIKTLLSDSETFEGGCFIATAAFGSYDHPAVKVFRAFRDIYLSNNSLGKKLINLYYHYGPAAAKKVGNYPPLRIIAIAVLFPLLIICFFVVKIGVFSTLLIVLLPYLVYRIKLARLIMIFVLVLSSSAYALENNTIGMKAGYSIASDQAQKDIYKKDLVSLTLFYDRTLYKNLSVDFAVGYLNKKGKALSQSGSPTAIETSLMLVPCSSSLKLNFEITPLVIAFVGGGIDYWYYKEKTESEKYDAIDDGHYGVGGYHGKAGLKLLTGDEDYYKKVGVIIEAVYSKIDRFDKNEIDLGGWTFNVGLLYRF